MMLQGMDVSDDSARKITNGKVDLPHFPTKSNSKDGKNQSENKTTKK